MVAEHSSQSKHGAKRRVALIGGLVALAVGGALVPTAAYAADPSADLSVGISHSPNAVKTGDEVTFTLAVANAGPDTAVDVVGGLGFPYPLQLNTVPEGCKRASSYESVLCDFGDLASGSTAEIDIVLQARGSGLITLPAAAVSTTADPDTADLTASDVILIQAGPRQAERYIAGIFPIILNRAPNASTTTYWANKWRAENNKYPRNLAAIPAGIINSNEYRRIRVREAYQNLLGRPADPAGLESMVKRVAGGWNYLQVERSLLTGSEFFRRAGAAPTDDPAGYISAVVQKLTGRSVTAAELDMYLVMLGDGQWTPRQKFVQYVQSTTDARSKVISEKFQDTVGHEPSSLSRYMWLLKLRDGVTPESLWAQLLVSNEVLQKYPYTEDDYPYEEYSRAEIEASAADLQAAMAEG